MGGVSAQPFMPPNAKKIEGREDGWVAWSPNIVRFFRFGAILMACVAAFGLRSGFSNDIIFEPDGFVNLQGIDSWYHLRSIDNVARNFPERPAFDPYLLAPAGGRPRVAGMFDLALGGVARVVGWGEPDSRTAAVVAAWGPVYLAALLPLVVYFLGSTLFNPAAGLAACWLAAISPGSLFLTSRLGFADHHIVEALLSTCLLLCLAMTTQSRKVWTWRIFAGLSLGALLGAWAAGYFVLGVALLWLGLQCLAQSPDAPARELAKTTLVLCGLALPIVICLEPHQWTPFNYLGLVGGPVVIGAVALALDHLVWRGMPRWKAALWVVGAIAAAAGLASLWPIWREIVRMQIRVWLPNETYQAIAELRPLFFPAGRFTLAPAWNQFTASALIGVPVLAMLAARLRGRPDRFLLLVWSIAMLLTTLSKTRASVYLAICFALLTGWAISRLLDWRAARPDARRTVALSLALALIYLPNLPIAIAHAKTDAGPPKEWREALAWLRDHTPEPFGDAQAYYETYPRPYPETEYGVLTWWDYGHWIIALGRRVPTSNGFQSGASGVAQFYLSQTETEALEAGGERKVRYVVTDESLTLPQFEQLTPSNGKIRGMAGRVRRSPDDLVEVFYREVDGRLVPFLGLKPEYYRSMLVRLETFKGEAQPGDGVSVVMWRHAELGGQYYRRAVSVIDFESYREAERYIRNGSSEGLSIVGLDPDISCVPLEKLKRFRMVKDGAVKIFELTPEGRNPGPIL